MVYAIVLGLISVFYLIAPHDVITTKTLLFNFTIWRNCVCLYCRQEKQKKKGQ